MCLGIIMVLCLDDGLFMMSYESFPQSTGQLQLATDAYDTSKTYEVSTYPNRNYKTSLAVKNIYIVLNSNFF